MPSPTTVTSNIADDNYELPYFTPPELVVIQEWIGDDENNVTAPNGYTRLLRILWRHFAEKTQPPPGTSISFKIRLDSFGFAKRNGSIMNNPLAEMVTLLMIRRLHNTQLNLHPYHHESLWFMSEKLVDCWNRFEEYLNLDD